jgi:putative toxin-antitoxin system antitoxin component (TIGR02293 family)
MLKQAATSARRPAALRQALRFRRRGESLGLSARSTFELIQQVEQGLVFKALRVLASNSGIRVSVLASTIGIPERTLARRRAAGKLTADESERLLRIADIFEKALALFEGNVPAAVNWLMSPKQALDGQPPFAYSRTELGAGEVADLIGRLEHGVFS